MALGHSVRRRRWRGEGGRGESFGERRGILFARIARNGGDGRGLDDDPQLDLAHARHLGGAQRAQAVAEALLHPVAQEARRQGDDGDVVLGRDEGHAAQPVAVLDLADLLPQAGSDSRPLGCEMSGMRVAALLIHAIRPLRPHHRPCLSR